MHDLIRLVEMLADTFLVTELRLLFGFNDLPDEHINWRQPLMLVCRDTVRVTLERQKLRAFLRAAVAERPRNHDFAQFVAQLPPETDLRPFANRMNFDPERRRPVHAAKPISSLQMRQLIELLADCFTVDELRCLYGLAALPSPFVNWDQALFYVCRDAVRAALERDCLHRFLDAAIHDRPHRLDLAKCVADLPATTNWLHYTGLVWAQLDVQLRDQRRTKPIRPATLRCLVDQLMDCFESDELRRLYDRDTLPHDFVNWNQSWQAVCHDAVQVASDRNLLDRLMQVAVQARPRHSNLARIADELAAEIAA